MKVERIVTELFESNVYILSNDKSAIIIDCGASFDKIEPYIKGKKVEGILLTHGHYDHSKYCNEYANKLKCKIYANENVLETLTDKIAIYSEDESTINDLSNLVLLKGDGEIKLGELDINYFHCPGHCKCCECYLIEGNLFAGDVLFERSVGRTDLKGSDKKEMINSLYKLENIEFNKVYSGHGISTSREEQMKNIRVYKKFLSR